MTISQKGRIVIPADLRKKYHLHPGREEQVVDYGSVLALVPALDDPIHQSAGILFKENDSLTEALLEEHSTEH